MVTLSVREQSVPMLMAPIYHADYVAKPLRKKALLEQTNGHLYHR